MGRRVYDNLVRSSRFIYAVHLPVLLLTLVPILLRWPPLLLPPHIVLLELLIDPACSLVLEAEAEAPDLMARPPRAPDENPFGLAALGRGLQQGLVIAVPLLAFAAFGVSQGWTELTLRGGVFPGLVLGCTFLVLAARGPCRAPNPLVLGMGGAVALALLLLLLPPLRRLLDLGPLLGAPLAGGLGAAAVGGMATMGWRRAASRREG